MPCSNTNAGHLRSATSTGSTASAGGDHSNSIVPPANICLAKANTSLGGGRHLSTKLAVPMQAEAARALYELAWPAAAGETPFHNMSPVLSPLHFNQHFGPSNRP